VRFLRAASPSSTTTLRDEDGFGLTEIVVSLFILAILSVAMLPLLVQGLRVAAMNATLATATQLVQDRMELTRSAPTCAGVAAQVGLITTSPDSRAVSYNVTGEIIGDACPATLPGVIGYRVEVARNDDPLKLLASAETLVLITAGP
jgi:prepilin-type N-terminal cleavage/methylation domain-containing protein